MTKHGLLSFCSLVLVLAPLSGCYAPKDQLDTLTGVTRGAGLMAPVTVSRRHNLVLPAQAELGVVALTSGEGRVAADRQLCLETERAFQHRFARVRAYCEPVKRLEALEWGRSSGVGYLILSRLLVHEDRTAPDMEGVRDGVGGIDEARWQFEIVEVASGRAVEQVLMQARSGALTYWPDSPELLIRQGLPKLVNSLSGQAAGEAPYYPF